MKGWRAQSGLFINRIERGTHEKEETVFDGYALRIIDDHQ
jgi:hypothetical protein